MITEEMKSTLLDIETNNPEGIQNLKAFRISRLCLRIILVSFNIQGEGFCEPFLVTYRTEELNPYLRYPRQTLNPNHLHVYFTKQVIRELMGMPYYDIEILDFIRVPS